MSVSGNMLKKIRVGQSEKYFILFFHFNLKWCKMQKGGPYLFYSSLATLKVDNTINSSHDA